MRQLASEFMGSAILACTVIGSGIMGDALSGGNVAIALLGNTLATGAILVVLIHMFGPISGAHFNPAVSLVATLRGELAWGRLPLMALAQTFGCILGVWAAHAMFGQDILQVSDKVRAGPSLAFSEVLASFGLVITILFCVRQKPDFVPYAVGLYITAAYWFTASTSFANPAITIARALSDTFAGIRPADVPLFIAAQCIGAVLALAYTRWQFQDDATKG